MAFYSLLMFTWHIFHARHGKAAVRPSCCSLSVPRLFVTSLRTNHGAEKAQTLLDGAFLASTFLKEGLTGHSNAT